MLSELCLNYFVLFKINQNLFSVCTEYEYEDTGDVRANKTVPHPCEKELDLYEMLPRDFAEPVKGRLSMCHSSGCDK